MTRAGSTAWIRHWWERVAPPELMGGSPRAVTTSKHTSQIMEQIGTGAEVRTTSDSSATREACTGTGSGERRHLSTKERWIQEARRKNESQLVSEDTILNRADIETEVHTSERLTLLLRQAELRWGEVRSKALVCLTLTMSERKSPCEPRRSERRTPCKPRRRLRRLRRMQW